MKVLNHGPAARMDRPASALLHDEPNTRIVGFLLQPGQRIPPHTSESTVVVQVLSGAGVFSGQDGRTTMTAGQCAVFAPGELHAVEAVDQELRFLALITPRPGG